jgi:hypothetical protein
MHHRRTSVCSGGVASIRIKAERARCVPHLSVKTVGVQYYCAATAPIPANGIQPHRPTDLRERPLATLIRPDGKEKARHARQR